MSVGVILSLREATLTSVIASSVTHQADWSASRESDLTFHASLQPGLKSVADQTSYQPTQGDVFLLSRLPQMVQEVIGQCDLNLRSCVIADLMSATGVAASAHWSVMSVVHPLSLQRRNLREKSRGTAQFEVPTLRYARIMSPSTLTKPNHRANRTCR